jgi:hypothetical protein
MKAMAQKCMHRCDLLLFAKVKKQCFDARQRSVTYWMVVSVQAKRGCVPAAVENF